MPEFTRDETMDDVLSEVARESGESEGTGKDPEVPVGEHIRAFREKHGMTVQQFAERTGFSAALLAQIENRMVSPSLGTLVKISNTFGTTVSSFKGGKEEREKSIVRKQDRTTVSRVGLKDGGKSAYTYESLGAGKAGRKMEPFLVRLQPLSEPPAARSMHDGEEFLYVLSGRV
ncbi:MAG: transcriptional regulator, HTH-type, partial [Deltaproteobacteria bacterium]|nr:transcriptional regulator, HTH-type [Deltaproteobacteria bacterium]